MDEQREFRSKSRTVAAAWTLLQDGNGRLFTERYDVATDEFVRVPHETEAAAEAYIRERSIRVIATFNDRGEKTPTNSA